MAAETRVLIWIGVGVKTSVKATFLIVKVPYILIHLSKYLSWHSATTWSRLQHVVN